MVMVTPELRFPLASVGAKTRSAKNVCKKDGIFYKFRLFFYRRLKKLSNKIFITNSCTGFPHGKGPKVHLSTDLSTLSTYNMSTIINLSTGSNKLNNNMSVFVIRANLL